jgi:hypothetical protein
LLAVRSPTWAKRLETRKVTDNEELVTVLRRDLESRIISAARQYDRVSGQEDSFEDYVRDARRLVAVMSEEAEKVKVGDPPLLPWPQREFIPKCVEVVRWMLFRPGVDASIKYASSGNPNRVKITLPTEKRVRVIPFDKDEAE